MESGTDGSRFEGNADVTHISANVQHDRQIQMS